MERSTPNVRANVHWDPGLLGDFDRYLARDDVG
jgi:hypothetical protein